jgi:hypothetical protein
MHFFVSNLAPLIAMKDASLQPGERLPLAGLLGSERFRGVETAAAWLSSQTEAAIAAGACQDPYSVQRLAKQSAVAETAVADR